MEGSAQKEGSQLQASVETGVVVNQPTSPEQIYEDAAAVITNHSNIAGHPTTLDEVKADQTFQITPDMEKLGVEPSGGGISVKDVVRNIEEEIKGDHKGTGVVKSLDLIRLKVGRENKGLKKAA